MAGSTRSEVASMARSRRLRTRSARPRAAAWASLGTRVRPSAPMKAVGRQSMGMVMPHRMPKELMASWTSTPAATSRCGMSTAVAEPIRLPSRLVMPTGRAMEATFRFRLRPSGTVPGSPAALSRLRRASSRRVRAENSSQAVMPSTMRATVRSGFWGRNSTSSPSTAAARINCSHSSTAAGGRTFPVP